MNNKYYIKKIKKLLEKNTHYETIKVFEDPTPYIMTNAKDYYKLMNYINKLLEGDKKWVKRNILNI